MQKIFSLKLLPSEAADEQKIINAVAQTAAIDSTTITGYTILKQAVDARGKQPWINLSVNAFIDEPFHGRHIVQFDFKNVGHAKHKVIIVGAGPAGLFAALYLIERGIQPIVVERGKDVKARRRDLALLNKEGIINPESNYCFGEGGAGTYSDGKLYTRSSKRGDIQRILNLFVHFGADEKILYESHPHIGTNKLPQIITSMREMVIACGGEVYFEKKVTDFVLKDNRIDGIVTNDGSRLMADAVILATGHSARDIFQLLFSKEILTEAKPFALGVRVEHPQKLIDKLQYHRLIKDPFLPPAAYSLVQQVEGKGVFSFCMCPGGIIAPAATDHGELVVNGWSPSKRNNPFANSGIVVETQDQDLQQMGDFENVCNVNKQVLSTPLRMMYFQQYVERKSYLAGGGAFVAPAQRMVDFSENKLSSSLPTCSYVPGIHSTSLKDALPSFIYQRLQLAFKEFGKKMKGYYTNEAVLVATESRTSSPVRIPRNNELLHHPQIINLYPCGEGAGYAGGIVSAAMDGERVAAQINQVLKTNPN